MNHHVVIADDHELMLEGICALLRRDSEYEIAATAKDGDAALEAIDSIRPALAVVDASMPGKSGIEVIAAGSKSSPETAFILVSMFEHAHLIAEAVQVGAAACVSKNDAAADLINAVRAAEVGDFFVSRSLASEWEELRQGAISFIPLSTREREVMRTIVAGASNKEIAELLNLSVRTIDHHRERLMRKIGARNAADVVRYAAQKGEIFAGDDGRIG